MANTTTHTRPATVPLTAVLLRVQFSEVCCHMRVAGTTMWVAPVGQWMAQLYDLDGRPFSAPITRGEAGLRPDTNEPMRCLEVPWPGGSEQGDPRARWRT